MLQFALPPDLELIRLNHAEIDLGVALGAHDFSRVFSRLNKLKALDLVLSLHKAR